MLTALTAGQFAAFDWPDGDTVTGSLDVIGDLTVGGTAEFSDLVTLGGSAPATATSTGTAGQIAVDTGFAYVCVATNLWRRIQLETWPLVQELTSGTFVVTKEMHGTTFINTGQTAAITMTAPTDAPVGTRYRVICNSTDAHAFWFKVVGGATVRHIDNVTTDGPYLQNLVGHSFEIELIETGKWLITNAEGTVLDATTGAPF